MSEGPIQSIPYGETRNGRREEFAKAALMGIVAAIGRADYGDEILARQAFDLAEAMLDESDRRRA